MKIVDAVIILSPGYGEPEPDHWIQRWSRQIQTSQMLDLPDPTHPRREERIATIAAAVNAASRPVVLVGHSLGAIAIVHAAAHVDPYKVAGAFLVAPSDWDRPGLMPEFADHDFSPIPRQPIGFPTHLVASRSDPYCDYETAKAWARDWGSILIDAGDAGHLNVESGQGPWPEGLTAFALFMQTL